MSNKYWFTRDMYSGQVHVHFLDSAFQNLNTFLAMASANALEDALNVLEEDPRAKYRDYPGDYLTLHSEDGWVTAEINLFGDRADARLPAELFVKVTSEYLQEIEKLCRELE
ncbi:MAG: hypothetical protein IJN20_03830 [Oscillospiraceae bacterium]|nr:hypothetical protein [Oscillospiraceae bacterium]